MTLCYLWYKNETFSSPEIKVFLFVCQNDSIDIYSIRQNWLKQYFIFNISLLIPKNEPLYSQKCQKQRDMHLSNGKASIFGEMMMRDKLKYRNLCSLSFFSFLLQNILHIFILFLPNKRPNFFNYFREIISKHYIRQSKPNFQFSSQFPHPLIPPK